MPVASAPESLRPSFSRLGILCLIGFAVLNGCVLWWAHGPVFEGYSDFASFYTAGRIVARGQSARLYDPVLQWQIQQEFAANVKIRRAPLPYIRPPFEALLFLPLAYLTYPTAYAVWLAIKIGLLLIIPLVLPPAHSPFGKMGTHALQSLLCFAFFPVGLDMVQGQDSILLLLILALALRLLLQGANLQSGAVLALGLFKFHLILPLLLILALARRSRLVLGFLATTLLLFLISLAMVHWAGVIDYPRYLWRVNLPEFGTLRPQTMPNLRGMATALLGGSAPGTAHWIFLGIVLLGVLVAARSWRAFDPQPLQAGFGFSVVIVLLTSYYANGYDLTLLLLPLLLIGAPFLRAEVGGWPRTVFLLAAAVLLCTPGLWLLVLRTNGFCWIALTLLALAVSMSAARTIWRVPGAG